MEMRGGAAEWTPFQNGWLASNGNGLDGFIIDAIAYFRSTGTNSRAEGSSVSAAHTTSMSLCSSSEAYRSAKPYCFTAARTTSLFPCCASSAKYSALPFCFTAARITSSSERIESEACSSASPYCVTAARATLLFPRSAGEAYLSAWPFCVTAASTTSSSERNSKKCSSAMPSCVTTARTSSLVYRRDLMDIKLWGTMAPGVWERGRWSGDGCGRRGRRPAPRWSMAQKLTNVGPVAWCHPSVHLLVTVKPVDVFMG